MALDKPDGHRYSAPDRQDDQRHSRYAKMPEQRIPIGVGLKRGGSRPRATEATGVIADHAKIRHKNRKLLIPHSAIEIAAVYQYNRGPGTSRLVIESAAGNGGGSRVGTRRRRSMRARWRDAATTQRQEGDR